MLSSYRRLLKVFLILLVSAHESSASCLCGDDSNDESNNTESNSENATSVEAKAAAAAKLRAELKEELKAEMRAAAAEAEGKTRASNTDMNVSSTTSTKLPSTENTDGNVSTVQVTVEVKKSDGEPFKMPNIIFDPAGVTQPQAPQAPLPVVNNAIPSASSASQSGVPGAAATPPVAPEHPLVSRPMGSIVAASRAAADGRNQSAGKLGNGVQCTGDPDCESGYCAQNGAFQICQPENKRAKVDPAVANANASKGNLIAELKKAQLARAKRIAEGEKKRKSEETQSSQNPQESETHEEGEQSDEKTKKSERKNLRGGQGQQGTLEPESESPSESNTDVSVNETSGEGNDEPSGSNVASATKKENGEQCLSGSDDECQSGKCNGAKVCVPAVRLF